MRPDIRRAAGQLAEQSPRAVRRRRAARVTGRDRLPPVDLLVAALADRHDLGVLHYEHDYDLIADKTDLRFNSVWLASRGSL